MSTMAEMRSRIESDILRTDLSTQINIAITRAFKFYTKEAFWFHEAINTFESTDGTEGYALSGLSISDLGAAPLVLTVAKNTNDIYPIRNVTYQDIRRFNDTGTNHKSTPDYFSIYADSIYFSPVPDASYTFEASYRRTYVSLADGATNAYTLNAEDLIESRVIWWVNKRILKKPDKAASAKEEEIEALRGLRERSEAIVSTGRLTGWPRRRRF